MPAPTSNLDTIKQKVRRLTRTPSLSQLSDEDLEQYINTFVVYDMPEHIRIQNLKTTFTFYTNPYQDVYITDDTLPTTNPLYDFQNRYISIDTPIYIAGYDSLYTQSRQQFYGIYPLVNSIQSIGLAGDGATTQFTGVVTAAQGTVPPLPNPTNQKISLLQNNVLFSSIDTDNNGLALVDVPLRDPATGNNTIFGNLYVPGTQPTVPINYPADLIPTNTINYLTGEFTITFNGAPGSGQGIFSQTVPQIPAIPQALLFYDETFIVRPIPDMPYAINFEAYMRPTYLMSGNQNADLQESWQYIAYGAARKILQDRVDMDTVALLEPEYKKQEALVLRRTLVQNATQRTATIYTEQTSTWGSLWGGWGSGGGTV
jgi:hypothetical protein